MFILGIETSCDETAASVINVNQKTERMRVLSNVISSQIEIHQKYGGVIPEIAAREHVLNILPVIHEALTRAKITPKKLDYLAITKGPGLITSLISGLETAKTLAYIWKKPITEVNHISGHIYSNFIDLKEDVKLPAIILTVSGGHTNLIFMNEHKKIKIIGETLDDAAGEAYDKAAKMMGLGYPGGPIIAKYAEEYKKNIKEHAAQNKTKIILPRPMLNSNNNNFSFSGLKTALLYQLQKNKNWKQQIHEYCFEYQEAIIEVLISKAIKAAKKYKVKTVMLSGGVSANNELRKQLEDAVSSKLDKAAFLVPAKIFTTDNAAMIAAAGFFNILQGKIKNYKQLKVDPSLQLK